MGLESHSRIRFRSDVATGLSRRPEAGENLGIFAAGKRGEPPTHRSRYLLKSHVCAVNVRVNGVSPNNRQQHPTARTASLKLK
jgi:hypothetical protein